MIRILAIALFSCAAAGAAAYPSEYFSEPITGRVVDASTNAPVPGVNVVLQWILEGPPEGHFIRLFHVEETVTDEDGRFAIPAWGPLKRPHDGALGDLDPLILLFKPGYAPRQLGNHTPYRGQMLGPSLPRSYGRDSAVRVTVWNGKSLELEPFKGSVNDYANNIFVYTGAWTGFLREGCNWKATPKFFKSLDEQMKREREAGVADLYTQGFMLEYVTRDRRCASLDSLPEGRKTSK